MIDESTKQKAYNIKRWFTGGATSNEIKQMDAVERKRELKAMQTELKEQLNSLRGKLGMPEDKY